MNPLLSGSMSLRQSSRRQIQPIRSRVSMPSSKAMSKSIEKNWLENHIDIDNMRMPDQMDLRLSTLSPDSYIVKAMEAVKQGCDLNFYICVYDFFMPKPLVPRDELQNLLSIGKISKTETVDKLYDNVCRMVTVSGDVEDLRGKEQLSHTGRRRAKRARAQSSYPEPEDCEGYDSNGPDETKSPLCTKEGNFICPLYWKSGCQKNHGCHIISEATEEAALKHANDAHGFQCPICKREKMQSVGGRPVSSTEPGKVFFDNIKNLRSHVLRTHVRIMKCPHEKCTGLREKTFALKNEFQRHYKKEHYSANPDFDLEFKGHWEMARSNLRKYTNMHALFEAVEKSTSTEELENLLYRENEKFFDSSDPDKSMGNLGPQDSGLPDPSMYNYDDLNGIGHMHAHTYDHVHFSGQQSQSMSYCPWPGSTGAGGQSVPGWTEETTRHCERLDRSYSMDWNQLQNQPLDPDAFFNEDLGSTAADILEIQDGNSNSQSREFSELYDQFSTALSFFNKAPPEVRIRMMTTNSSGVLEMHDFIMEHMDEIRPPNRSLVSQTHPASYYPPSTNDTVSDSAIGMNDRCHSMHM